MPLDPINNDEYRIEYSFDTLHIPNINYIIVNKLRHSADYIGYRDILEKYGFATRMLSVELWSDLADQLIEGIKILLSPSISGKSTTQQSKIMKQMQKDLAKREEGIIVSFEDRHVGIVSSDDFIAFGSWRATLGVMARCVVNMIKHDMCSNSSNHALELSSTVSSSFAEENIQALFTNEILSTIYYIAGWHLSACLKTGRIRVGKKGDGQLGQLMINLFECGTINADETAGLPTGKILRTEMFGGLNFVSASYFEFVLRMEYVFMKCLTSAKLAVLGNGLIQQVYQYLCECADVRLQLQMIILADNTDEDTMNELVLYLVQTYCRMRGKDFCRQIMSTDFKNLGKGVRPTLAVLSDKKSYTKVEVGVEVGDNLHYNLFDNLTTFFASNINTNETEDIISEDDLINMNII